MTLKKNNRLCVICGDDYYRRGKRNFKTCSIKCKAKYNSLIQTGKPQVKKGEMRECEVCGKGMYLCQSKMVRTRFCSMRCRNMGDYAVKGEKHHSWKGGKTKIGEYVYVKTTNHPFSHKKSGYVAEHRLVMEKKLGRYLTSNEQVHHKNGIKIDNKISNLEIVVKKIHFGEILCPHCQKQFKVK